MSLCKNVIEAPSKPDVIFKCPKCHKELITYDKRKESQPKAVVAENPKKTKQKNKYSYVYVLQSL